MGLPVRSFSSPKCLFSPHSVSERWIISSAHRIQLDAVVIIDEVVCRIMWASEVLFPARKHNWLGEGIFCWMQKLINLLLRMK